MIDQFEEIFTGLGEPGQEGCSQRKAAQRSFLACVLGALAQTPKLKVIVAMRADFFGKCIEEDYSGLGRAIEQNMVSVLPLEPEELAAAICEPAEQVGLTVEPTLVQDILAEIAGAPGSLPLLQYTLKALWQQRQGNQLTLTAYKALGGITGTLDQRATALYESFSAAEQRTVQHIFQQLTQLGEGTEDTRRRVFLANLVAEPLHPAGRVERVLSVLAAPEHRLLVLSGAKSANRSVAVSAASLDNTAIVDVAHEALIRHWRLLRGWIETNRDLLRQQRRIEASAVAWQERGKAKGYLLQGLPLREAVAFQQEQGAVLPLSEVAKGFVRLSVRARRWDRVKVASWLLIPAAIVVGLAEYNARESRIKDNLARLDGEDQYEERQVVQELVAGCWEMEQYSWVPKYLAERFFGHCESLFQASLIEADLRRVDLRKAHFRSASFRNANLRRAYLRKAYLRKANLRRVFFLRADLQETNLRETNLRGADLQETNFWRSNLWEADLRKANLWKTNLQEALLLATDFRESKNLAPSQLTGEKQPLLCNVALPANIKEAGIDSNRNCEKIPQALVDWYNYTLEDAQAAIEEARQIKFE